MRNVVEEAASTAKVIAQGHSPKATGRFAVKWESSAASPTMGGAHGWQAEVSNDSFLAAWIELGVQPHAIDPEDGEAIATPDGPRAGAMHPGTRALHPLGRAMDETEAALPGIAEPHLREWSEEIESNAARHQGITKT